MQSLPVNAATVATNTTAENLKAEVSVIVTSDDETIMSDANGQRKTLVHEIRTNVNVEMTTSRIGGDPSDPSALVGAVEFVDGGLCETASGITDEIPELKDRNRDSESPEDQGASRSSISITRHVERTGRLLLDGDFSVPPHDSRLKDEAEDETWIEDEDKADDETKAFSVDADVVNQLIREILKTGLQARGGLTKTMATSSNQENIMKAARDQGNSNKKACAKPVKDKTRTPEASKKGSTTKN